MSEQTPLEEIIRHFHLQWDHFPFAAMLIRKDRKILAVNIAAQNAGITTGLRCCDLGNPASHRVCRADIALRGKTAERLTGYAEDYGLVLDSYWVPLAGEENLYLHFSIDITDHAPHLVPAPSDGRV